MSLHEVFLQDILANPDDDTPRLIYADWLDDHGQPERAQLIRLQCELAKLPEGDERYAELDRKADELEVTYAQAWLGPLQGHLWSLGPRCERGFPSVVKVHGLQEFTSELFQKMAAEWFPRAGVMSLQLHADYEPTCDPTLHLPALAASPVLRWLHTLDIRGSQAGDDGMRLLAASPYLANLKTLIISKPCCSDAGLRLLVESPFLQGLTRLTLIGANRLPQDNFRPRVSVKGLRPFLDGSSLPRLRELGLRESDWRFSGTEENFTKFSGLAQLESLNLWDNRLGDDGVKNLAACESLANLVDLNLARNSIGEQGVQALLNSPNLRRLERIDLRWNEKLRPATVERLQQRFGNGLIGCDPTAL